MGRKRYTVEQIIRKLREAEVELGRGLKTPQVCRKLGISVNTDPAELTGQAMTSLVLEPLQETWSQWFIRCFGDPEEWQRGEILDLWLRRADLSELPITISLQPHPWDSSTYVVAWLQDMTKHHQTQEALRKSEQRFRLAARHTADWIQEANYETDELELFGDIDSFMGYPPGEFPRTLSGWYRPGTWVTDQTGHIGDTAVGPSSASEVFRCPGTRGLRWTRECASSRRLRVAGTR